MVVEDGELVLRLDDVDDLLHGVGGVRLGLHLGLVGLLHPVHREAHHRVVERRGVEHRRALLLRRQVAHDAPDVGYEAHVEHAVSLVDDERVDVREVDDARLDEVEETPRRRDQKVDGRGEHLPALAVVVHSAVDGEGPEAGVLADRVGVLADLDDELAGRRDHEGARIAALLRAVLGAPEVAREDRDEERGGLAGSRLRLAGDVLACERLLEREGLDLGAVLEPEVGDAVHHLGRKVEVVEALLALDGLDLEGLERPRRMRGLARGKLLGRYLAAGAHLVRRSVDMHGTAASAVAPARAAAVFPALSAGLLALLLAFLLLRGALLLLLLAALGLLALLLAFLLLAALLLLVLRVAALAASAAAAFLRATGRVLLLRGGLAGDDGCDLLEKTECHD